MKLGKITLYSHLQNMLKQITSFLALAAIFVACEHLPETQPLGNNTNNNDTTQNQTNCSPDTAYFVNEVLPLINSKCAQSGCHSNVNPQEGVQLDNYQSIINTGDITPGNPTKSDLYKEIVNNKMPPGNPLTQAERNIIKKWIEQGAKNNRCNSGCDETKFAYQADIKSIIDKNCIACHSTGNVLLTSHANVSALANNGRLMGALRHQGTYRKMPSDNIFLSDCDLNKIQKWIDNGTPNN